MINKFSGSYIIVFKEAISDSLYKMVFEAPDIARNSRPGQFIQIKSSDSYFPLWPRPFSIYDADPKSGFISIIFKVFGGGTALLASKEKGHPIHLFGPLGNYFPEPKSNHNIVIGAGGVGLPPLYFLAKRAINDGHNPDKITLVAGARTRNTLMAESALLGLGLKLIICTDDGSAGIKGNVVDVLTSHLEQHRADFIYACGPNPMLKGVDELISKKKLKGCLSLEALMPCGYGICSGCAVKVIPPADRKPTDDKRDYHLKRVCVDGPIFDSGEVIWDG